MCGGGGQHDWFGFGYIHGDMNTSDGLTNAMSSSNMRSLLTSNTFRIVTEEKRMKLGKRCPQLNTM